MIFFDNIVAPRKKRTRPKEYELITVQPWTDGGAVDQSKIVTGKRQRKGVSHF